MPCLKSYFVPWDLKLICDKVEAAIIVTVAKATTGVQSVLVFGPLFSAWVARKLSVLNT